VWGCGRRKAEAREGAPCATCRRRAELLALLTTAGAPRPARERDWPAPAARAHVTRAQPALPFSNRPYPPKKIILGRAERGSSTFEAPPSSRRSSSSCSRSSGPVTAPHSWHSAPARRPPLHRITRVSSSAPPRPWRLSRAASRSLPARRTPSSRSSWPSGESPWARRRAACRPQSALSCGRCAAVRRKARQPQCKLQLGLCCERARRPLLQSCVTATRCTQASVVELRCEQRRTQRCLPQSCAASWSTPCCSA
jgi:hypothetical protein